MISGPQSNYQHLEEMSRTICVRCKTGTCQSVRFICRMLIFRRFLSISHVCLYEYLDMYLRQGLDGLRHLRYKGKRNLLDENRDLIIAHLETQPPGTLKEAQARIEEITGIKRSLPQIRAFLKKTPFAKESETSSRKGQHRCTGTLPHRNLGASGG